MLEPTDSLRRTNDGKKIFWYPWGPDSLRPDLEDVVEQIDAEDFIAYYEAFDTGIRYATEGDEWAVVCDRV